MTIKQILLKNNFDCYDLTIATKLTWSYVGVHNSYVMCLMNNTTKCHNFVSNC